MGNRRYWVEFYRRYKNGYLESPPIYSKNLPFEPIFEIIDSEFPYFIPFKSEFTPPEINNFPANSDYFAFNFSSNLRNKKRMGIWFKDKKDALYFKLMYADRIGELIQSIDLHETYYEKH